MNSYIRLFESFSGIKAAYSTKNGGYSTGIYESMNLGFSTGDKISFVKKNYQIICSHLGVPSSKLVFGDQKHHNKVCAVKDDMAGSGFTRPSVFSDVDGLCTNCADLPLVTLHADCAPIYFYDPIKKVIGLAHAGWRGTSLSIVSSMLQKMSDEYGCEVFNIYCAIGPCICKNCFEADSDCAQKFFDMTCGIKDCISYKKNKCGEYKYFIDIAMINYRLLVHLGIKETHIEMKNECTVENKHKFFSHRRDGLKRGSQAAFLMLV